MPGSTRCRSDLVEEAERSERGRQALARLLEG